MQFQQREPTPPLEQPNEVEADDPVSTVNADEVFNNRVAELMERHGLTQQDVLKRLAELGYPSRHLRRTVLLSDAMAMAAALNVSLTHLLLPYDDEELLVTPDMVADANDALLWLRGYRELDGENADVFYSETPETDFSMRALATTSAEAERALVLAVTTSLRAAVREREVERTRLLKEIAEKELDDEVFERIDRRAIREAERELQAVVTEATRFLRQYRVPFEQR